MNEINESYQQKASREAAITEPSIDPEKIGQRCVWYYDVLKAQRDTKLRQDIKLRADIKSWWDKHKAAQENELNVESFYELAKIIQKEK